MRDKAVLPGVERMLTLAVKRRAAEGKCRRRRGSGMAIIAFAALALGGTAMAATGVWNPLGTAWNTFGGNGAPAEEQAHSEVKEPPSGSDPVGQPRHSQEARRHLRTPGDKSPDVTTSHAEAMTPYGAGAPQVQHSPQHTPPQTPSNTGAGRPEAVDDGASVDPSRNGEPGHPGHEEAPPKPPPGEEKPGPRGSQTSLVCSPEAAGIDQTVNCRATVHGEGRAPTGQIYFKASGPGFLPVSSCTLIDDGTGETSSCGADYTPTATGAHQLAAYYSGDAANTASQGTFVLKAQ